MSEQLIHRVRQAIYASTYRLTTHAEQEREADAVTIREVEEAFGSSGVEVIEDYPNDPRGHSILLLGFSKDGSPLHAVVAISDPEVVFFVTIYRPNPELWYDWRRRRP